MAKRIKKIVAREFLLLLGSILFYSAVCLVWGQLHQVFRARVSEIGSEVYDIEHYEPLESLKRFVRDEYEYSDHDYDESRRSVWEFNSMKFNSDFLYLVGKEQAAKDYVATVKSGKYKSDKKINSKFPEFGFDSQGYHANFSKEDETILIQKKRELTDAKETYEMFYFGEDHMAVLALLILSVTFVLRYLYYAIHWSVKTLRE
jgi:hypothetical protein